LLLLTHRYYDPATGRFLNRDPIGSAGGVNLYSYVNNRPTHLQDVTGTIPALIVGCLACAACMIDLALVCSDSGDSLQSWVDCCIGVVQNLPWWMKLLCGGACIACLIGIVAECAVETIIDAGTTQQQPHNPEPCSIDCEYMWSIVCAGQKMCEYRCTDSETGETYWTVRGPDENGDCDPGF